MNKIYLITQGDGNKLIWKGQIQNDNNLVWLCKEGKRLWSLPAGTIRLLHFVEALVMESQGVRSI